MHRRKLSFRKHVTGFGQFEGRLRVKKCLILPWANYVTADFDILKVRMNGLLQKYTHNRQ